jgi:DNA-binding XRE family transcriptional regulator
MVSTDLPIYDRAVARYPFLSAVQDAKLFCQTLCRLAAVPSVTPMEYFWEWGKGPSDHAAPRSRGARSPIAAARMAAGMTQAQLAEAIGCKQLTISRWERGEFSPNASALQRLSDVLGCPMEDLLP